MLMLVIEIRDQRPENSSEKLKGYKVKELKR
jgi:hypothetical protein